MKIRLLFTYLFFISLHVSAQKGILVIQTDFGQKDAAVATMKGVAMQVSTQLRVFDLTHEIPPFNIWEAAYRLEQTAKYWPAGTVFVSVVDPGVGTQQETRRVASEEPAPVSRKPARFRDAAAIGELAHQTGIFVEEFADPRGWC